MARLKPADYLFWAVGQNTGNSLRNLILIHLCNRAGKDGTCYPSHASIARDCACTTRAVRTHIAALEKDGLIKVRRRVVEGMRTSSTYSFPLVSSDRNKVPSDRNDLPNVRNMVPVGAERGSGGVRNEVPIKHPVLNTQLNTHITPYSPPAENSDFDRFYEAYPKKVGRKEAERAWKKLNPSHALINRIMRDIADRVEQGAWCTGKDKAYIPGPAPYLNQEKWTDQIIPRPGFKPPQDFSRLASEAQDLSETF